MIFHVSLLLIGEFADPVQIQHSLDSLAVLIHGPPRFLASKGEVKQLPGYHFPSFPLIDRASPGEGHEGYAVLFVRGRAPIEHR